MPSAPDGLGGPAPRPDTVAAAAAARQRTTRLHSWARRGAAPSGAGRRLARTKVANWSTFRSDADKGECVDGLR